MNEEFKNSFDILDIDEKRNQISNELMRINAYIAQLELKNNIKNSTEIKNYNPVEDNMLDESEILTYFYEDIYNIEQELVKILSLSEK